MKPSICAGEKARPSSGFGIAPMKGMDGRSFLPVLKGKKQNDREFVYTHINTIASGRSYTMLPAGKRYDYLERLARR